MDDDFAMSTRRAAPGTVVLSVRGEIDLLTAPEFKQAVCAATSARPRLLAVDLTETTFLDSSSLGALIGAHRRQARRGDRLVVVCCREEILRVLRVTGLDGVFQVVDSLSEALAPLTSEELARHSA